MKQYNIVVIDLKLKLRLFLCQDTEGYFFIDIDQRHNYQRYTYCNSNNVTKAFMWITENLPFSQFEIIEYDCNMRNP